MGIYYVEGEINRYAYACIRIRFSSIMIFIRQEFNYCVRYINFEVNLFA